jgi:hypothetical protein
MSEEERRPYEDLAAKENMERRKNLPEEEIQPYKESASNVGEPRKSKRARAPSSKYSLPGENATPTRTSKPSALATTQPIPKTPQELYNQIKKSRDKLFFIAYSHNKDPLITGKDTGKEKKVEYKWYLVRVDLSTCQQLEETQNCMDSGKYYVEFYTKASFGELFYGLVCSGLFCLVFCIYPIVCYLSRPNQNESIYRC